MSGWRVVLWRRDRRGVWSEVTTFPGDRVADALREVKVLTVANSPEVFVALPAGQVPTA